MKEFEFTNLMKCGNCGSGICAEEKFNKLSNGSTKRYVYYHCIRGVDRSCKEPLINEEDLIKQFEKLIDRIPINQLKAQKQLTEELEKLDRFNKDVLKEKQEVKKPKVDIREFAKYVLKKGGRGEKRTLLACLDEELTLKARKIRIK